LQFLSSNHVTFGNITCLSMSIEPSCVAYDAMYF
jgi:hypothetical protein